MKRLIGLFFAFLVLSSCEPEVGVFIQNQKEFYIGVEGGTAVIECLECARVVFPEPIGQIITSTTDSIFREGSWFDVEVGPGGSVVKIFVKSNETGEDREFYVWLVADSTGHALIHQSK